METDFAGKLSFRFRTTQSSRSSLLRPCHFVGRVAHCHIDLQPIIYTPIRNGRNTILDHGCYEHRLHLDDVLVAVRSKFSTARDAQKKLLWGEYKLEGLLLTA